MIKKNGYEFICTCSACPEQYDVFRDGEQIAYVRKRWGNLAVNPVKNGKIIFGTVIYSETEGDAYAGTIDNIDETIDNIIEAIERANTEEA